MQKPIRLFLCLAAALLMLPAAAQAKHAPDRHRGHHGQHDHGHHGHSPKPDVKLQLLALNDFHGNLEPNTPGTIRVNSTDATGIPAGGAAYLAGYLRDYARANRNTLTVSAGDLIGASPLTSALFHDEPTIEAMNAIGLDINAVGNHEFDEGLVELKRMQDGGCRPAPEGCYDGVDADSAPDGFRGADFRFLAANVVQESTGKPIFPPYTVRKFDKVRVGFIGLTLEGTPDIVAAAGIQGLKFLDEADTINRYADKLRRRHGVKAIVVLLHQGGFQAAPFNINGCNGLAGEVVDIVNRTDDAVDMFITGHTHSAYNCVVDNRPVTSASSFGRLFTDIDATLDRRTRDFKTISANNVVVRQTGADGKPVPQAADISALVEHYQTLAAPLANRIIGELAGPATKVPDNTGENQAGNLIADSQQASAAAAGSGSVAAFMNPGGVRGDTGFAQGPLTYAQAFAIQPFGNTLVTLTLTGAQLREVLKQQWCGQSSGAKVLLPSAAVHYTFDQSVVADSVLAKPCATAPDPITELTLGGTAVDPAASYRITVNNFLADGGDGFTVLRAGTNRTGGAVDLDALVAYLEPSVTGADQVAPALNRIDLVP
jgi:5'-nucleotidase